MTEDWLDALVALESSEVRFLVIGAHALAVHGVPRGTQDLDVWIDPEPGNAARAWRAMADFESAWADRTIRPIRGHDLPFLGRETLIANKRATGRTKDLADLETLGEGGSG